MDRQHRPGVQRAHEVVHHVAEAMIHDHGVGGGDVELLGHQVLGAGNGDVGGDIQSAGEAAHVVQRLGLLDDREGRHQFQVESVVVIGPEHDHQFGVEGLEFGDARVVAAPEVRRQAAVLGFQERNVGHAGEVDGGCFGHAYPVSCRSPSAGPPRAKAGASGPAKTEVALRRSNSHDPSGPRTQTSSKSPIAGISEAMGKAP